MLLAGGVAALAVSFVSFGLRSWRARLVKRRDSVLRLNNRAYAVEWKEGGEMFSTLTDTGYDLTRRTHDRIEPAGRALFVSDVTPPGQPRTWPVIGNFPEAVALQAVAEHDGTALILTQRFNDIQTRIRISLPSDSDTVELWEITVANLVRRRGTSRWSRIWSGC